MRNMMTPHRVAESLRRLEYCTHLWDYKGPRSTTRKKILGITFDSFMPGFSNISDGISFLTHVGHKGWSLTIGKNWSLSLFKNNGKWYFRKAHNPSEPFYQIMFDNAQCYSIDQWKALGSEQTDILSREQVAALKDNSFEYRVKDDIEYNILLDGAPVNNRPITDDDKYEYVDDPFYTQWHGGSRH